MKAYLDLCRHVLDNGSKREDRTGTGTIGVFGYQMRFNLMEGFPLLTTKKIHFPTVCKELLWFISGDTNIKWLVDNKVRIWNEWPYQKFTESSDFNGESMEAFVERIKNDDAFAKKYGDLGPVYGKQWRDFFGVDQLKEVIESIKLNPTSRRHIVSAWNPSEIENMALPPCHAFMQFYVEDDKLSLQLYQRSGDIFLGIPFNIASYSLLLMMVAKLCNLKPYEFIHSIGDAHIYLDHIDQVYTQLSREPKALGQVIIHGNQKTIDDFRYEDFEVVNYNPHAHIKGKVSV